MIDIAALVASQRNMMSALRALEQLDLPDAWIAAGFVRNAVWDRLHGRGPDMGLLADVDVVFFCAADTSRARERTIEAMLSSALPGVPWSVRNQARMHIRNGDSAYRDTADALSHWLETATAVGVRIVSGRVELLAPLGVDDLTGLILRPTLYAAERPMKLRQYWARIDAKEWRARWPMLRIIG